MKKIKVAVASLVAAVAMVAAFTGGCAGSAVTTEYKTEITVTQVETPAVQYAQSTKEDGANSLINVISAAVSAVYGESASTVASKFYDYAMQAADCCEQRGVSEDGFTALVSAACAQQELLISLVAQDGTSDLYAAVQLFADITEIVGADVACHLVYDCSLIFCNYKYDTYITLYEKNGYAYLLRYATEWDGRAQSVRAIGEENFEYLLKTTVSAASLLTAGYSDSNSLISGFSAGEAALYLRAQGYMTAKLTLTADDWAFVFTALSDSKHSDKMAAICAVGAEDALAENFAGLVSGAAYALTKADTSCAQAALDGDISAFLCRLLSAWGEEEWAAFTAAVNIQLDSDACAAYFTKVGAADLYAEYEQGITPVTLGQVRAAAEEDFYALVKGYVATNSPQLAFILFEL